MITTNQGYERTKALIKGMEEAIARQETDLAGMHPLLAELTRAGQASLLTEWREEVAEYEALRDGRLRQMTWETLPELGAALRQARLAAGLTQAALAERAGLAPEQVASYEAADYREAPLAHCQAVIAALGAKVKVEALIVVASPRAATAAPTVSAPTSR
jgi:DNA-binding XRE family transcriptional regulator